MWKTNCPNERKLGTEVEEVVPQCYVSEMQGQLDFFLNGWKNNYFVMCRIKMKW